MAWGLKLKFERGSGEEEMHSIAVNLFLWFGVERSGRLHIVAVFLTIREERPV